MNLTRKLRASYTRGIVRALLCSNALQRFRYSRLICRAMSLNYNGDAKDQPRSRSYEDALETLNELQSNLSAFTMATSQIHQSNNTSKADAERFLQKSGITMEQLSRLSVIHVSGTKGKGSTCALTESILRATGVRTGFYSSPHLVDVTERFRLDGKPISRVKFAKYFWRVYEALNSSKEHEMDMPAYFKFLTVMAFHVFLGEKVDVAILEVGIGGEHDCTNIVQNTKTAGITALGLDHTQLLGNTIADIAWQKTGIIKSGCNVFVSNQPAGSLETIRHRAREKSANLQWVPDFSAYKWNDNIPANLGPAFSLNGSLAIQLAYDWMKRNPLKIRNTKITEELNRSDQMCLTVFDEVLVGFQQCHWPGRFQTARLGSKNLYIDGSHTAESLEICIDWFKEQTKLSNSKNNFLIFNVTGGRDACQMLSMLHSSTSFALAAFVPNVAHSKDSGSNGSSMELQKRNAQIWQDLEQKQSARDDTLLTSKVFASVEEVFQYLDNHHGPQSRNIEKCQEINVLVTGSLYLVGAVTQLLIENETL